MRFLQLDKILVATLAGCGLLIAQPSLAQQTNSPSFSSLESDRQNGLLSSPESNFNVLEMMHRASQGNFQWDNQAKKEELDEETASFRVRQEQLLQPSQPQNPASPTGEAQKPVSQ